MENKSGNGRRLNRNIIFFLALVVIFLVSPVAAETVLEINFVFQRDNGSVEVSSVAAMDGRETIPPFAGGSDVKYLLEVLSLDEVTVAAQEIPVSFYVLTDPPKEVPSVPVTVRLPFSPSERKIRLTGPAGEIVLLQSFDLCNRDGKCDLGENRASCPSDCPAGGSDGYCEPAADGVCDPDCARDADPDCAPKTPQTEKKTDARTVLFLTALLLGIAFYLLFIRKGEKPRETKGRRPKA
jgi:hypothetical protein